ncbi:MAG TPA: transglycosylase domain-containing protein [Solirubrobacteraceae bacterium]|nr:transglycosylase domain-containing protein [Solirubrobacteraceae bacterium]
MSPRLKRKRRRRQGGANRAAFLTLGVLSASAVIAALSVVGYVIGLAASGPSLATLKPIDKGASSLVFAADGSRLGFIQSDELRSPITAAQIPQLLRDATVAIEDQRFYKHKGVDFQGVVRAALRDLGTGKTVQGGSTITMQLVRNLYLPNEARNFTRKVREAKLAEELETSHPGRPGKLWILTEYLNTVPYGTVGGQSAVGVQAAARIFFDKSVGQLTLPEAALIAGLPQAPSDYNPFSNPQGALLRRNDVLQKMAAQHYITPAQAQEATASPLGVRHSRYYTVRRENYFFDYVKQQLIDEYGPNRVRQGGLRVFTTIDLRLQTAARKAIAGVLNQPNDPSSAIVTIDPRTGYIRAMASSAIYGQSKFNLAAQGHGQPGSTFKIMVLMTAVKKGIDPASTTYESKPLDFVDPRWGPIKVQTYSHSYSGSINLVQATLKSDNTVYQQLDLDVGPKEVARTAHEMGITTHLDGYPAEGLGGLTLGVSPLEMANAYATIASGGWRNKPIAIARVVFPDHHVDNLGKPQRVKVFSDAVTSTVTKIMEQNMQGGTATHAQIGCPAAAKTGTTDNFTDAWLDGFTPHLATAVWVGYPNRKVPMTSVHGIQVQGGSLPADIWHDYMTVAHGSDCAAFPAPKESINFSPFASSHRQSGTSTDSSGGGGSSSSGSSSSGSKSGSRSGSGSGSSGRGGQGGRSRPGSGRYQRQFYETPPQKGPGGGAPAHRGGGSGATGGTGAGQ